MIAIKKHRSKMKIGVLKCQTHHIQTVQAHSAKADQNPYVLRTPGILENVPERRAKPNCAMSRIKNAALAGLRAKTSQNKSLNAIWFRSCGLLFCWQACLPQNRPRPGTSFSAALCFMQKEPLRHDLA